jgi:PAS domain S-box-containing protein
MSEIVTQGLYLLAGICIYASVNHFNIGLRQPFDRTHLLFAGMCLLAASFAIFHALAMRAVNISEFAWALKGDIASPLLFFLLFPWFIALYTGKRPLPFLVGLNILFATLFIVNLTEPYSLQYEHIDGIRTLLTPWGESVTRGIGNKSSWIYVVIAGLLAAYGYALYALGSIYRSNRRGEDLGMLFAVLLALLTTSHGILARLSIFDDIEFGPFGFVAMVITMSLVLANETQQRLRESERRFRTIIEQSPIGMSFSRDGYTVDVNAVLLKMFGYNDIEEVRGSSVINRVAPQCRAEVEDRIRRRIHNEPTEATYETTGLRKDGSQFPLSISAKRIVLSDGPLSVAFVIDMTERKRAEEELLGSQQKLRELSGHLEEVREAEQARIAREIHDELGQLLTLARIDLVRIISMLSEPKEKIEEELKTLIGILERTADVARTISENLRPGMLDALGLGAALEHHIARFSEATGISCSFELNRGELIVDSKVATAVFRIVQEALTNVARHSEAQCVNIQLVDLGSEILVIIQDDGRGMPEGAGVLKRTYGLLGMKERVTLLGGTLQIESAPGSGTRIEASIPTKPDKRLNHD